MEKNTIGQFIAALRKANGLTQQNVADRLNVSNKAVSRWERDECAPDLSLIPALAELFGVTCDELLKGTRIPETPERKEPKVDKQVKALINRTLSGFKLLIWIALGVSVVGLVCMFGISYGFYRPVIGFAVMLLFEACAFVLTALAVSRARDVKTDNELFEMADTALVSRFDRVLGKLSFGAFYGVLGSVVLSLPLILVSTDYVDSVMTAQTYFAMFFGPAALILALVYLKAKTPYLAWITDTPLPRRIGSAMTGIQVSLAVLAGFLFILAPYLDRELEKTGPLYLTVILGGIACLAANPVVFLICLVRERGNRKKITVKGIRNMLLIPCALLAARSHYVGWYIPGGGTVSIRYDGWAWEFLVYAVTLALAVFLLFGLMEGLCMKKKA